MREVTVRATWSTVHTIEVEDDAPQFASDDLEGLFEATGEDIDSSTAELTDWDIRDPGPS